MFYRRKRRKFNRRSCGCLHLQKRWDEFLVESSNEVTMWKSSSIYTLRSGKTFSFDLLSFISFTFVRNASEHWVERVLPGHFLWIMFAICSTEKKENLRDETTTWSRWFSLRLQRQIRKKSNVSFVHSIHLFFSMKTKNNVHVFEKYSTIYWQMFKSPSMLFFPLSFCSHCHLKRSVMMMMMMIDSLLPCCSHLDWLMCTCV